MCDNAWRTPDRCEDVGLFQAYSFATQRFGHVDAYFKYGSCGGIGIGVGEMFLSWVVCNSLASVMLRCLYPRQPFVLNHYLVQRRRRGGYASAGGQRH